MHITIPIEGNPVGSDADGFFTFINHKGGMEQNNNDVACQKKRHLVAGNSRNISYRQGEERNENNREKKSCEKRGEIVYGDGIIIPAGRRIGDVGDMLLRLLIQPVINIYDEGYQAYRYCDSQKNHQ